MRASSPAVAMAAVALLGALVLVLAAPAQANAQASRSRDAVAEFKRLNPCPATGQSHGKCPGYVVELVVPRCADGRHVASNMTWHLAAQVEDKRRWEQQYCQFHRQRQRG